ncbi:hypothetical protein GCM10023086_76530 [Streptomyces venetus]|uniref:Uncharacterized protein n=1 Tax=Streptomyces venetus TaxID=1701086 RepID=A0ABP8HKX8_9ACTN
MSGQRIACSTITSSRTRSRPSRSRPDQAYFATATLRLRSKLQDLPLPTAKAIEIVAFVPLDSVDPLKIGEGYYLTPRGQVAAKPYKLLRMAFLPGGTGGSGSSGPRWRWPR